MLYAFVLAISYPPVVHLLHFKNEVLLSYPSIPLGVLGLSTSFPKPDLVVSETCLSMALRHSKSDCGSVVHWNWYGAYFFRTKPSAFAAFAKDGMGLTTWNPTGRRAAPPWVDSICKATRVAPPWRQGHVAPVDLSVCDLALARKRSR